MSIDCFKAYSEDYLLKSNKMDFTLHPSFKAYSEDYLLK